MKLKFVANFRNRPSKVLWNTLYRNFISNLVLYTTPKLICFEFLSCLNKGLNHGWWLRVTHSWHTLEVSAAKLISQVNKITFRHFAQKLWIFINCHILSYIWVQQKEWAALKSRIYFTPQFQELFTITSTCFQTLGCHVSRESNQMQKFSSKGAFFLLNLVYWNEDRRLNQFSRPKFELDSAHVRFCVWTRPLPWP